MEYSKDVNNIIEKSKKFAILLKRPNVCIDTLFHCLLQSKNISLSYILKSLHLDKMEFQILSEINMVKKKDSKNPSSNLSKDVKNIISLACEVAEEINEDVTAECLFMAILRYEKKPSVIKKLDQDYDFSGTLIERTWEFLNDKMPIIDENQEREGSPEKTRVSEERQFLEMFSENEILKEFAENLNLKASTGEFDNLVNFVPEKIEEITATLLRKKKANVVLVGDGGCGKTQIVNLLSKMIVDGEATDLLLDKVIYSVDLSKMVAGTEYRGQFEKRLTKFIEEAKKYENLILFFDEVHTMIGAGSGGRKNELEASNMLKPALASGELSVIGATTTAEYEATIKNDSALERRFHRVVISEPSNFKMLQILPALSKYYEKAHDISFGPNFLNYLVENCDKFLPNRRYPDKAIDVLDTIGARAKMKFQGTPEYVKKAQKELLAISENIFSGNVEDESELQKKIAEIKNACDKWESDYVGQDRTVEESAIDEFFLKKKKLSLRGEFYKASELLDEKRSEQVKSYLNIMKDGPVLFFGERGSGKTTVCKALLDFARRREVDVMNFSGMDFSLLDLYKRVLHSECSLIVIDDLSSIHPENVKYLCKIFKDKRIERPNGEIIDFSNVDFILTCDAKKRSSVGFNKDNNNLEPNLNPELCKVICNKFFLT